MRITTHVNLSPVSDFREDAFDTPAGVRMKNCACSYYVKCLYHWYYEDKGGEAPKDEYRRGQSDEAPQRAPRKRNGVVANDRRPSDKRRYQSPDISLPARGDTSVRSSEGRTGDRPKPKRKPAKRS